MKKKNLLTERRMLMGLIALLFVMGLIHTMGIITLTNKLAGRLDSSSQTAQVPGFQTVYPTITGGTTSNPCLTITNNVPDFLNTFEHAEGQYSLGLNEQYYQLDLSVKNICTTGVYLITPSVFNQSNGEQITNTTGSDLQVGLGNGTLTIINPAAPQFPVAIASELLLCTTCVNGSYPSPLHVSGSIPASLIEPGQTKKISFLMSAFVPNESAYFYRTVPKSIKWFYSSALTDNNVLQNEVKTYTFSTSAATREQFGTNFLRNAIIPEGGMMQKTDTKGTTTSTTR